MRFQPGLEVQLGAVEKSQGIINKYLITIDPEVLYQSAWVGPDRPTTRSHAQKSESDFLLFSKGAKFKLDMAIRLQPVRYGQYIKGVDTFSGSINDDETTTFVISIENYQINGQIRLGEYLLKLQYDRKVKSHILALIDLRLISKDYKKAEIMKQLAASSDKTVTEISATGGSTQAVMSAGGDGNIRVLFYYTAAVEARNNVNALVANILSELNTSIDLSRINPEIDFTSAGILVLANNLDNLCRVSPFPFITNTITNFMQDREHPFENVDAEMTQASADISLIIGTTEPTYQHCSSVGRIGGVATIFEQQNPLAMTTDTYALGDLTAVHEIGHVIGGNHEIDSPLFPVGDGTPSYARGYASTGETWQTIMGGYAGGCPFVALPGQPACIRLNRWSNPAIYYQGEVTGVANESDMESALEINAPIVSGWTAYPDPAPASAPSLTVSPGPCFGFNVLLWPTVNTATHYQLFQSTSAAFSGGGKRISVSVGVNQMINVPYNSTRYYRVRACNGNGCSPYSSIKSASYYNGCP